MQDDKRKLNDDELEQVAGGGKAFNSTLRTQLECQNCGNIIIIPKNEVDFYLWSHDGKCTCGGKLVRTEE